MPELPGLPLAAPAPSHKEVPAAQCPKRRRRMGPCLLPACPGAASAEKVAPRQRKILPAGRLPVRVAPRQRKVLPARRLL